jgi:hypothetical protein
MLCGRPRQHSHLQYSILHDLRCTPQPGSRQATYLVVSSRWIRLAPRVPAIILIMCLPLMHLTGSTWCGLATIIVYVVFLWESFAGLEKDWRWFEPKDEEE